MVSNGKWPWTGKYLPGSLSETLCIFHSFMGHFSFNCDKTSLPRQLKKEFILGLQLQSVRVHGEGESIEWK